MLRVKNARQAIVIKYSASWHSYTLSPLAADVTSSGDCRRENQHGAWPKGLLPADGFWP
jgi:hypothetical protein